MPLVAHIMDVGCGNMVLIVTPNGWSLVYDCNITQENKKRVLAYVDRVIGRGSSISVFVNSHRDADHMRGIKRLHCVHRISQIWDSGVPGTTTDSTEYREYMELCRSVPTHIVGPRTEGQYGGSRILVMNSHWPGCQDSNEQSMVMKVEYGGVSLMLAGDTNYRPWKEKILTYYGDQVLHSSILLASHHGSIMFFGDPSDSQSYFIAHMKKIVPAMTIISVGANVYGLPDRKAVELYEMYSSGSAQGHKVFRTDKQGTMRIVLKDDGGWELAPNQ